MKLKIAIAIILITALGYVGLAWSFLEKSSATDLIICSLEKGAVYIPQSICQSYLVGGRKVEDHVKQLEQSGGVKFILAGSSAELNVNSKQRAYEITNFFLSKGANINLISSTDGMTALHAEVLANNPETVKFLIARGADLTIREKNTNLTPLEFAQMLSAREPKIDRAAVIKLLTRTE